MTMCPDAMVFFFLGDAVLLEVCGWVLRTKPHLTTCHSGDFAPKQGPLWANEEEASGSQKDYGQMEHPGTVTRDLILKYNELRIKKPR